MKWRESGVVEVDEHEPTNIGNPVEFTIWMRPGGAEVTGSSSNCDMNAPAG